jgi:hypothetical protein
MGKSREFLAQWGGACGNCDEHIDVGDFVQYVDDELCHVECPEVKAVAVCPSCFLVLPVAGVCVECET